MAKLSQYEVIGDAPSAIIIALWAITICKTHICRNTLSARLSEIQAGCTHEGASRHRREALHDSQLGLRGGGAGAGVEERKHLLVQPTKVSPAADAGAGTAQHGVIETELIGASTSDLTARGVCIRHPSR